MIRNIFALCLCTFIVACSNEKSNTANNKLDTTLDYATKDNASDNTSLLQEEKQKIASTTSGIGQKKEQMPNSLSQKEEATSAKIPFSKALYDTYFNKLNPAPQVFTFKPNQDKKIVAEKGTKLNIKANTFVDKNGNIITEDVKLEIQEFYSISDMIKGQLSTKSNGKLLRTAGMVHIKATTLGSQEECFVKQDQPINLSMPTDEFDSKMLLFEGDRSEDSIMNWEPIGTLIKYIYYPWEVDKMAFANNLSAALPSKLAEFETSNFKTMHDSLLLSLVIQDDGDVIKANYISEDIDQSNIVYKTLARAGILFPRFEPATLDNKAVRVLFPFCIKLDTINKGVSYTYDYKPNAFENSDINLDLNIFTRHFQNKSEELPGQEFYNYQDHTFSILKLKWINCDAFMNEPIENKVQYIANNLPDSLALLSAMIFKDMKGLYTNPVSLNKKVIFKELPNRDAIALIYSIDTKNDVYYATTIDFKPKDNNKSIPVTLQTMDKTAFNKLLISLNK